MSYPFSFPFPIKFSLSFVTTGGASSLCLQHRIEKHDDSVFKPKLWMGHGCVQPSGAFPLPIHTSLLQPFVRLRTCDLQCTTSLMPYSGSLKPLVPAHKFLSYANILRFLYIQHPHRYVTAFYMHARFSCSFSLIVYTQQICLCRCIPFLSTKVDRS